MKPITPYRSVKLVGNLKSIQHFCTARDRAALPPSLSRPNPTLPQLTPASPSGQGEINIVTFRKQSLILSMHGKTGSSGPPLYSPKHFPTS